MNPLLVALVRHALDNCPKCGGSGEVATSNSLMFGKPLGYAPCTACKDLRNAYKFATDPA